MQTLFTLAQLADADVKEAEGILRSCVHCGFCTATCPTYVLLGDERDSPRGRIYLIKEMLEGGETPSERIVMHIDRCLGCLSCMTTCPSGINYMHLVDHARRRIEAVYKRPLGDRLLRWLLVVVLTRPGIFRLALMAARLGKPLRGLMPERLAGMVNMAPARLPVASRDDRPQVFPAQGERRKRVALMTGCAQKVLSPEINAATVRLLTRHGCEVVVAEGAGCCGALPHHMGREDDALASARANVVAWSREVEGEGLDAVVINTSGCGNTVKDYGFMLRDDAVWAARAKAVSERTRDVSEVMAELGLAAAGDHVAGLRVAYQAPCSLQHGQKITAQPKTLLKAAGFDVSEPAEPHLCCGSAGAYNLLQPGIATQLKAHKLATLAACEPTVIASGNIGCMT
ncbi:MAG: glycolate oxidase subunit GlcF, partial [Alphaproteobacteria bacterium]|nr:glycolate oxidase subunit GlcF [Alphaproteobacteria bacterium]